MVARLLVLGLIGFVLVSVVSHAQISGDFRDSNASELRELILEKVKTVEQFSNREQILLRQIEEASTGPASNQVRSLRAKIESLEISVDQKKVAGPGIKIVMQDAPRNVGDPIPPGAVPDDLIVHEQDVLAAINALWRGGAEAVLVMGIRIGVNSTILCVGNTLLVEDQVFSPPFVIQGIGDQERLLAAIETENGLKLYRQYVQLYRLGYEVSRESEIIAPAYTGRVTLNLTTRMLENS
jgi:uncharacterized protein YlxW (UPF0749 family)